MSEQKDIADRLEGLNVDDIANLMKVAEDRMEDLRKQKIQDVKASIKTLLEESDLQLHEVFPESTNNPAQASAKKAGLPPKYKNPDDPAQQWSGRGRKPEWFKIAIENGTPEEDMLIS